MTLLSDHSVSLLRRQPGAGEEAGQHLKSQVRSAAMRDKQAEQTPWSCPWVAAGAVSPAMVAAC